MDGTTMEPYRLTKLVWSDTDFAALGWHDATIWAVAAIPEEYEFLLDLDYIFKWVEPADGEDHYKFWVSPVTMLFRDVHSVKFDLESRQGSLEIANLHRGNSRPTPNGKLLETRYNVECQEGEITLWATGFEMHVRRAPTPQRSQRLSLRERGGISLHHGGADAARPGVAIDRASPDG